MSASPSKGDFRNWRITRILKARPRTFVACGVMVAVAALLPEDMGWPTRILTAWNVGAIGWLVSALTMMMRADPHAMRRRAAEQDDGATMILVISSLAGLASLVAIAAELGVAKGLSPGSKLEHVLLSILTILTSWLFVQTTFTLHYAHVFYGEDGRRGGLMFPSGKPDTGKSEPDYLDFAYFAVNLGAASQTSDVQITSASLRRVALAHSILAFFFNTGVLALGINVAASLIGSN